MTEEWRRTHVPDYEVSNLGRVRSLKFDKTRLLQSHLDRGGYPHLRLAGRDCLVHRLVAVAFIGLCPLGQEVLHQNDNAADASAANLRYGTHQENCLECVTRGRYNHDARGLPGESQPNAVLTEVQVRRIRAARGRVFQKALALKYNVSQQTISDIQRRKGWTHV